LTENVSIFITIHHPVEVLRPSIAEVTFKLVFEILIKVLILIKLEKKAKELAKFISFFKVIVDALCGIKNSDEVSHHKRKHRNTKQKHECTNQSFEVTSWVEISKTNSGEGSKEEIGESQDCFLASIDGKGIPKVS